MLGVASRRRAEELIRDGQVTVENRVVKNVASRIFPYGAKIKVNNKEVRIFTSSSLFLTIHSTSHFMHGNGNLGYGFITRSVYLAYKPLQALMIDF